MSNFSHRQFMDLLRDEHQISEGELAKAFDFFKRHGGDFDKILVRSGAANEELVAEALAQSLNVTFVSVDIVDTPDDSMPALADNQKEFLKTRGWLRMESIEGSVHYLTHSPLCDEVWDYLDATGQSPSLSVCSGQTWRILAERSDGQDLNKFSFEDVASLEADQLRELADETPVINIVNSLFYKCLKSEASDLHLEPQDPGFKARARIDGVLRDMDRIPASLGIAVVSRIKILAAIDIAEKRRPQDGKIATKISGIDLDIRVSTLPSARGEGVVLRFLKQDSINHELSDLGISADIEQQLKNDITKTSGVILLTGPTGSGKTTTLYSILNRLNSPEKKIITLEDPVEYQLSGINQTQVKADIGFDFARGLRSILRQDPDVVMVGEIRDQETAQIATQAALTGHMVFSTLHTNDALGAYVRLIDLGVEEFLVNASLVAVMAQRLVRRLCERCRRPSDKALASALAICQSEHGDPTKYKDTTFYDAVGCDACSGSGYRGRVAVVEYVGVDNALRAIPKDENFQINARKHLASRGVRSLLLDGIDSASKGLTSIEEVLRVAK